MANDASETITGKRMTVLSIAVCAETDANSTFSHEFGHHLGLPDLYKEPTLPLPGREFTESWCEMAFNRDQNFAGIHASSKTGSCQRGERS
jgi:M6 family metalloprotease-like protein